VRIPTVSVSRSSGHALELVLTQEALEEATWPCSSRRIAIVMSWVTGSTPSVSSTIRCMLDRPVSALITPRITWTMSVLLLGRLEKGLLRGEVL
jgi:hypothetical protein